MKCYISGTICKIAVFWKSNCYIWEYEKNCYFLKLRLLHLRVYLKNCHFFTKSAAFINKNILAKKYKNNIIYEIDCSSCEAVYFGESKQPLKSCSDEHKRSVRNCNCDRNQTAKHCWEADHKFNSDQKKVIDRESRLIPRTFWKNVWII